MAISYVGSASNFAANGGDVTVTLPGGIAENDIVVVVGGHGNASGAAASISTSGYNTLDTQASAANYSGIIAWKRMGVSPDTTVTGTGGGDVSSGVAYIAYVVRGVDTSTAIDATTTEATGTTGLPNSPSITTVTDNALVITAGLFAVANGTLTPPAGYSNALTKSGSDTNGIDVVAASRIQAAAGAVNPSGWGAIIGDSSDDWVAWTVALRPAASGTFGDGALSGGSIGGTTTFVGVNEGLGPFAMTGTGTASFAAEPFYNAIAALTGTETSSWVGTSISSQPVPFSMTGTGTASFVGALQNAGVLSARGTGTAEFSSSPIYAVAVPMTGTASVFFVGAVTKLSHVREVIESKGAATVSIS
jgi:hypothetical protein